MLSKKIVSFTVTLEFNHIRVTLDENSLDESHSAIEDQLFMLLQETLERLGATGKPDGKYYPLEKAEVKDICVFQTSEE